MIFIFFIIVFYTKDYLNFLGNISKSNFNIFYFFINISKNLMQKNFLNIKNVQFEESYILMSSKYLDKALTFINNASLIFKESKLHI